jgi:hypothetical protein
VAPELALLRVLLEHGLGQVVLWPEDHHWFPVLEHGVARGLLLDGVLEEAVPGVGAVGVEGLQHVRSDLLFRI